MLVNGYRIYQALGVRVGEDEDVNRVTDTSIYIAGLPVLSVVYVF